MTTNCPKCGGTMERGLTNIQDPSSLSGPAYLKFLIPGTPIPWNPIEAFKQGLHGEGQSDQLYGIVGARCSACGYLELYAPTK